MADVAMGALGAIIVLAIVVVALWLLRMSERHY